MSILKISTTAKILIVFCCGLLVSSVRAGVVTYNVSLDTSPLIGGLAGPFSLAFQLTDGSFLGDTNNTITLSSFNFGGGGVVGSSTLFGGATGSLISGATLTDSLFLNFFIQGFNPGTLMSFQVATTNNVDAGGTPDLFSFSILDSTGQELPTQTGIPFFSPFVAITIDSPNPSVQTFSSDPTQPPAGGGPPLIISQPQVSPVPEPASMFLIASAVVCASLHRRVFRRPARIGSAPVVFVVPQTACRSCGICGADCAHRSVFSANCPRRKRR